MPLKMLSYTCIKCSINVLVNYSCGLYSYMYTSLADYALHVSMETFCYGNCLYPAVPSRHSFPPGSFSSTPPQRYHACCQKEPREREVPLCLWPLPLHNKVCLVRVKSHCMYMYVYVCSAYCRIWKTSASLQKRAISLLPELLHFAWEAPNPPPPSGADHCAYTPDLHVMWKRRKCWAKDRAVKKGNKGARKNQFLTCMHTHPHNALFARIWYTSLCTCM